MKVQNRAAGQVLTIPVALSVISPYPAPAGLLFPLFLPQDTVNALSDFLRFGLLVPVGGGNGFTFVLPLFRGIDFIPVFIHQPKKGSILSAAVSLDFVKVHAAERNKN